MNALISRNGEIQEAVIEEFGDDVEELSTTVAAILEAYPDAKNQEIIDFLVDHLLEFEEIEDTLELVEDFKSEWGMK